MTTAQSSADSAALPVGDLEPGSPVYVRASGQSWQGYYVAATATTITITDWSRWVMGDNRPVEGKPNEDVTITVDDTVTVAVQGEEEDIPVVWPEREAETTAHTTTPLKIPARKLRKGDKISMGTIADVEVTGKHVLIEFECRIGKHGTAFPLDLEVTVLSRAEAEVDVVAELTALADRWDRSGTRRKADAANHRVPQHEVGGMIAEANQLRHCATMLRELIDRLA